MPGETRNRTPLAAGHRRSRQRQALPSVDPTPAGGDYLSTDPIYLKSWIEIQKRHDVPVNAIGLRIDPKDQMALKRWRDAGIDRFLDR